MDMRGNSEKIMKFPAGTLTFPWYIIIVKAKQRGMVDIGMNRFREHFMRFMIGRYGADKLGQFLIWTAFILMVVRMLIRNPWINTASSVCLVWCCFRMFSKNIGKRFEENQRFERICFRFTEKFRRWRFKLSQIREYHIYKCPGCGQKIRIPRGKGRISIHCPKCNTDFIKKS